MQRDVDVPFHLLRGVAHGLRQAVVGGGMLLAQPACRVLAAALLPVEQDLRLIGFLAMSLAARLPPFLPFALRLHGLFFAPAFELAVFEPLERIRSFLCLAGGVGVVVAAVAAQAQRRQFDDARHGV